jgi:hypothetical protein
MKTRQEMIYEFMVALASNPKVCDSTGNVNVYDFSCTADRVFQTAIALANSYLGDLE